MDERIQELLERGLDVSFSTEKGQFVAMAWHEGKPYEIGSAPDVSAAMALLYARVQQKDDHARKVGHARSRVTAQAQSRWARARG